MRKPPVSTLLALSLFSAGVVAAPPAAAPVSMPASGYCPARTVYGEGVFSRPGYEWRLTFSPDRTLALWSRSDTFFPVTGESVQILYSRWHNGQWSAPQVAPFSGVFSDVDPAFAPDGKTLYFSSRRPISNATGIRVDFELWSVTYRGGQWGTPRHLRETTSPADELYPSIDRHGRLYFGSNRDAGQFDVWTSRRRGDGVFAAPAKVGNGVNTAGYWEFNPEISPDGNILLFVALNRPDGYGYGDIYASVRLGQHFTPGLNMGSCINTPQDDYHPTVLWDRGRLIWMHASVDDASVPPNFYTLNLPWLRD